MAFKKRSTKQSVTESPDLLFRELPRRKFPDVLPHQQSIMQRYAAEAEFESDVALQLPTGSGKTLVGLLIAEWRRRKNNEKIVYLCPTKQLVNQAVEQAETKYGLSVIGFTGSKHDYDPSSIAKYKQGMAVAVTTYSSIFNTKPFFEDPDIIIVDDAHAAENYVSKLWSLEVDRFDSGQKLIHQALCSLLKPHIDAASYSRMTGNWDSPTDRGWVDKLPTPIFDSIKQELTEVLDESTADSALYFPWSMLRSHLQACHLYISSKGFLLRPLLPPTWAHAPFNNAKQRIYMSATLGEGGDLERLLGRKKIYRLAIPDGWDTQGVGRRFFIFPSLTLREDQTLKFFVDIFKRSERSLVLVPSDSQCTSLKDVIREEKNIKVFGVEDIEESKTEFVMSEGSVAIIANRYDGIDFPGNECRLLVIEGLPKTVNLQEQFLMSRIGAAILFNERILTRVIQAIGRCTRSLEDYSAVVVSGDELVDFLADKSRRGYFHPELQAELEFGVEQSIDSTYQDLLENYDIFLENGDDWEDVNNQIVEIRAQKQKIPFPGIEELASSVAHEIQYVSALWSSDYEEALNQSENVLGRLISPELKGYRAIWEYLAGSSAYLANKYGEQDFTLKASQHFDRAKRASTDIPWLNRIGKPNASKNPDQNQSTKNDLLMQQVEGIESLLTSLGCMHDRNLVKREQKIRAGMYSEHEFEEAHRLLGEHLGFDSRKIEDDASPDPWWQLANLCFVFEDHANAESDVLSPTKARQASSHPNWIRENVESCKSEVTEIIPVLISPVSKASRGAVPHLGNLMLWNLEEFRNWSSHALDTIRELRATYQQPGDLVWRAEAAKKLEAARLDINSIKEEICRRCSKDILTIE